MTNKTELSDNVDHLKSFMEGAVAKHSFVESWNDAREEAKTLFTHSAICRLDASGFIKTFKLRTSNS
jgi:hypothetical protein